MIYIHFEFEFSDVKSPMGIIICSKTDDLAPSLNLKGNESQKRCDFENN